ncbi:2-dehydro-3-deoxygalactonokinase [Massilia phyllosphaerae]|uniref:2-dehydro-3-deoxygalactonokinase n=1 Tax=Massilia phyllosphaerae TaxID=3106034 RepID=UPI002B1CE185|nr:2-dehydro-3-deoxygalactonokinase [Massilia sp. SGZ-792]
MNDATRRILGIDWGTSNRRAYLVDGAGSLVDSRADDQGMLAAGPDFGASLAALLADMGIDPGVPVLASGMIGSAQGWRETPYLDAAVALEDLPLHLVPVPVPGATPGRSCRIVPGYRFQDTDGRVDVMRGEEMQLLGAVAMGRRSGWFVLPGTHSKWVRLEEGVIRHVSTFMTGEFFATLGKQGTLAPLMKGPDDDAAFAAGVDEARRRAPLTHALFGVRARAVTGAMPAAQVRSFVSGLLIGVELVAALDLTGPGRGGVTTVAAPKLQGIYATAAARLGIDLQPLDPDAVYRAALGVFLHRMDPHEASPL